jgi:YndJ-like protein
LKPQSNWREFPIPAGGGVVWLGLVTTRLTGLTRLTLIDLLFVLAPLVIAPLGLRLIAFGQGPASRLLEAAVRIQPIGAALATVSFLLPIGRTAAILASGWLLVCAIAALGALADLIDGRSLHPVRLAPVAAVAFMAFGAVWPVLSRGGIAPLGLSPIVVELTAVHFHFTGFAATLMAALVLTRLRRERGPSRQIALAASLLMIAGSPVIAAGWGTPFHVLQVAGAILVAAGVIATASILFFRSASLVDSTPAGIMLRVSALTPLVPMVLAVEYSAGRVFGFPTLDIHTMALIHGDLNALGFSLLGLVSWSLGRSAYRISARRSGERRSPGRFRPGP